MKNEEVSVFASKKKIKNWRQALTEQKAVQPVGNLHLGEPGIVPQSWGANWQQLCLWRGTEREEHSMKSRPAGRGSFGWHSGKRKIHSQRTLSRFRPNKFSVRSNAPSDYSSLSDSQLLFGSQFCPENVQSAAAPLELGTQLGQHNSQDVSLASPFSPAHPQPTSKLMENTENRW